EALFAGAFGAQPYARPAPGVEASVSRIGAAELTAFFREAYAPAKVTVVVVGDFDAAAARARLMSALAGRVGRAGGRRGAGGGRGGGGRGGGPARRHGGARRGGAARAARVPHSAARARGPAGARAAGGGAGAGRGVAARGRAGAQPAARRRRARLHVQRAAG